MIQSKNENVKTNNMHFDNIEIGTADFRLLIDNSEGNGICVEPVPFHFNRLPDREGWEKLQVAISDKPDIIKTMYYVNPEHFDKLKKWARGCNSLGKPHPTIDLKYQLTTKVKCITMKQLFNQFDVTSVGLMKLDTEGHDYTILKYYFATSLPKPKTLIYESNELTPDSKLLELEYLLNKFYRFVRRGRFNTTCKIPKT